MWVSQLSLISYNLKKVTSMLFCTSFAIYSFLLLCTVCYHYYSMHHVPTQGRASTTPSTPMVQRHSTLGACYAATPRPQRTYNLLYPSKTRGTDLTYHTEPHQPAPNLSAPTQSQQRHSNLRFLPFKWLNGLL